MADRVYNLVKGRAGWVLSLDGVRLGGVYGSKRSGV
jgi:hypothetical protein